MNLVSNLQIEVDYLILANILIFFLFLTSHLDCLSNLKSN